MAIFQWDILYSVNHVELDNHHKKLFEMLNKLYDLMAAGVDDAGIIEIIDELLNYTVYHFFEEERMMAQIGYPDLDRHKQLHNDFVLTLKNFQTEANNGKAIFVAIKIANLGMDWLKSHILIADGHYKSYLSTQKND